MYTTKNSRLDLKSKSNLNPARLESEKCLQHLIQENKKFVESKQYHKERKQLIKKQNPKAVIVCCSDSRVPPEIVFQKSNLGELFVVRTAGHVLDKASLESIQFAVDKLKCNCIIVLAHENCGAVGQVYNSYIDGEPMTYFEFLSESIIPSLCFNQGTKGNINASVKRHCKNTARQLINYLDYIHPENVHACYYHTNSGKVDCLCVHKSASTSPRSIPANFKNEFKI